MYIKIKKIKILLTFFNLVWLKIMAKVKGYVVQKCLFPKQKGKWMMDIEV